MNMRRWKEDAKLWTGWHQFIIDGGAKKERNSSKSVVVVAVMMVAVVINGEVDSGG